MEIEKITFDTLDIGLWMKKICEEQLKITSGNYAQKNILISIDKKFTRFQLSPVHLVTLACLIQCLRNNGASGRIKANADIIDFFKDDLHLNEYFSSETPYVQSESDYNLNLWKVSASHSLMYSQHVADYLKRKYFTGKDLSGLKIVLDELYANIADHSNSHELAYSFIKYDSQKNIIRIAFCDFGVGIKSSLLKSGISIPDEYIKTATTKGVTARSNSHNRGFGLDTVVSSVCNTGNAIKILSGTELFVSYGDKINQRTWMTNFDFNGTLIYFDVPISSFEDADYVNDFEL